MKDELIQEHPLIATATALGVGLLAPIGLKMLAQQSTQWREGLDTDDAEAAHAAGARRDGFDAEYIYRHPLLTTGVAIGAVLLAPVGLNLLEQLQASWSEDEAANNAPPESASAQLPSSDGDGSAENFIKQHPLVTTAAALGVGLLAPIGLKMLAQQSTQWREDLDPDDAEAAHAAGARRDDFDKEYIYRHPLLTTGAALGAVLLAPAGLNLLAQLQASWSEDKTADDAPPESANAQVPRTGVPPRAEPDSDDDGDVSGEDFIQQHPFATAAAALGVGLLAPIGLNLMAQLQAARTEAAEAAAKEREPARAKSPRGDAPARSAADRGSDAGGQADDNVARQRAFMTNAATLGVGLLGVLTLASQAWQRHEGREETDAETSGRGKPPAKRRRGRADRAAHDVGALDMEFATHRPGGKNIQLNFGWKKRPVDAPETDWPTDNMGFKLDLPDGKETTFKMARKSRPVPAGYGDVIRRGLGEAALEFVSRRPDDGTFRFTWEKIPPATAPGADEEPDGVPDGRDEEPAEEATRAEPEQEDSEKSPSD